MFVVLGPLLLALAGIGIYAVVAYSVAQRTTEMGVRMALGATPARLVRQVLRDSFTVVLAGAAPGWFLVWIVNAHVNRSGPFSYAAFFGVPALLLGVAAMACWIPARRAANVDPMLALRRD
jgi:ABC-type antimicrobial peptide transport system permease subunit